MPKHDAVFPSMPLWHPKLQAQIDARAKASSQSSKWSRDGMVCLSKLSAEDKRKAWTYMQAHQPQLAADLKNGTGLLGSMLKAFPGSDVWVERTCTGLPAPTLDGHG